MFVMEAELLSGSVSHFCCCEFESREINFHRLENKAPMGELSDSHNSQF